MKIKNKANIKPAVVKTAKTQPKTTPAPAENAKNPPKPSASAPSYLIRTLAPISSAFIEALPTAVPNFRATFSPMLSFCV
jgi:hypothetical protein